LPVEASVLSIAKYQPSLASYRQPQSDYRFSDVVVDVDVDSDQEAIKKHAPADESPTSRYETYFEVIELAAVRLKIPDPSITILMDSLRKAVRTGNPEEYDSTNELLVIHLKKICSLVTTDAAERIQYGFLPLILGHQG
jgi:hypothetical protein